MVGVFSHDLGQACPRASCTEVGELGGEEEKKWKKRRKRGEEANKHGKYFGH